MTYCQDLPKVIDNASVMVFAMGSSSRPRMFPVVWTSARPSRMLLMLFGMGPARPNAGRRILCTWPINWLTYYR